MAVIWNLTQNCKKKTALRRLPGPGSPTHVL